MSEMAQHRQAESKHSRVGIVDAVFVTLLLVVFIIHVILGTALWYGLTNSEVGYAAWIGVGFCVVHGILSIATTVSSLTKSAHSSVERKKHLIVMWITGVLIGFLLFLHLTVFNLVGFANFSKGGLVALVLMVIVGIHVYLGIPTLTHNLNLSPEIRKPLRIGVIFFFAFMTTVFFLVSL